MSNDVQCVKCGRMRLWKEVATGCECGSGMFTSIDPIDAYKRKLIAACEGWCGMDAYEHGYDKPCDEHSCDNARGKQCSADELLDFIKQWETK